MADQAFPLALSRQARCFWAKTDQGEGEKWLPLFAHMADACCVARLLWTEWLPEGTRQAISRFANGDEALVSRLVAFVCAAHDVGKAVPIFQARKLYGKAGASQGVLQGKLEKAGLKYSLHIWTGKQVSHPVAGQIIMEAYFAERFGADPNVVKGFASIVGAHHGKPANSRDVMKYHDEQLGWDNQSAPLWKPVQFELLDFARSVSGLTEEDVQFFANRQMPVFVASLVCGLVIMADWIASNQDLFPLVEIMGGGETEFLDEGNVVRMDVMERRAEQAWEALDVLPSWRPNASEEREVANRLRDVPEPDMDSNRPNDAAVRLFAERFHLPTDARPRPLQQAAIHLASTVKDPGIMVIEAPMGEGKTEAALMAAEMLCARTNRGGVCVALPTMATTDAMFGRVHSWVSRLSCDDDLTGKTMYLAHGKAQLNEEFSGMVHASRSEWSESCMAPDMEKGESAVVSTWLMGRKKGMLANFVVCTVDQVLMGALCMKHLALRQLSLANKVVIVDECHAYDAYMQEYLKSALSWLGAWRTPVILLSATLPSSIRESLVSAYIDGRKAGGAFDAPVEQFFQHTGCAVRGRRRRKDAGASSEEPCLPVGQNQAIPSVAGCATASPNSALSPESPYPLITYSEGTEVKRMEMPPSGRTSRVDFCMLEDDDCKLAALLEDLLSEGGCAGVVCDTVRRAQETAAILARSFGDDAVKLAHARFIDLDRMENEEWLRSRLGSGATVDNGRRPEKLIVVGTQVLEQSLDIDFDVMVTDVAPVDLAMQRVGRLHRHARGNGQGSRPAKLRTARCFVRGVSSFEEAGPVIEGGVNTVYGEASLLETLSVLGLTDFSSVRSVQLPQDISGLVQAAYGKNALDLVPGPWQKTYGKACAERKKKAVEKTDKALKYRLEPAQILDKEQTLEGLFTASVDASPGKHTDEDRGQRAVRDTQETVEVLLAWHDERGLNDEFDGELRLLPWVGEPSQGVERGAWLPTSFEPPDSLAKVLAQCAVRLPLELCRPDRLDALISELEATSWKYVAAWQTSPWLAGRFVVPFEKTGADKLTANVFGVRLVYTRSDGLAVER